MAKQRKTMVDLGKLCSAMRASRKVLEPYRVARREAVRKYAGDQWSTETSFVDRPVNFLSVYLQIVSRSLISHNPQGSLSTFNKDAKPVVSAMEDWMNPEIEEMNLAESIQRVGIDAIYCMGIMKVALATPGESERSGWTIKYGQPYATPIDLDDWVMDPHARSLEQLSWCGHRSRVMIDSIKDSDLYEKAKRKKLQPNVDRQFNQPGDERISMLGRQYVTNDLDEAYEFIDIWEIYLPMEKKIITLLSNDGDTPDLSQDSEAFAEQEWVGPYCGPYHFLSLMPPVSGNAMPKGPIQDLIGLDEAMNGIVQKLMRQAARQKDLLMVASSAESDGQRISETADGEVIRVDNPDKVKPAGFGGPNPNNQAFSLQLWDFLNKIGGNIELMGGLGQQSKTATQDKMLNANAGMSMRWMQQSMIEFTSSVMKSLCWFWHHHPQKVMTSYHPIQGLANPIERKVTPQDRQKIDFEDIRVRVDPYSLQHQSPDEKLAFLNQVIMQILTPILPMLQQQGIGINMAKYLELVAKYGSSPDLSDIITAIEVPQADPASSDAPSKPGNTTRTYNRVNASEKTEQGQSKAMQQALQGQNAGGNANTAYAGA